MSRRRLLKSMIPRRLQLFVPAAVVLFSSMAFKTVQAAEENTEAEENWKFQEDLNAWPFQGKWNDFSGDWELDPATPVNQEFRMLQSSITCPQLMNVLENSMKILPPGLCTCAVSSTVKEGSGLYDVSCTGFCTFSSPETLSADAVYVVEIQGMSGRVVESTKTYAVDGGSTIKQVEKFKFADGDFESCNVDIDGSACTSCTTSTALTSCRDTQYELDCSNINSGKIDFCLGDHLNLASTDVLAPFNTDMYDTPGCFEPQATLLAGPASPASPAFSPFASPAATPFVSPVASPIATPGPTLSPSLSPTDDPTTSPVVPPTDSPTDQMITSSPTTSPTEFPTDSPTTSTPTTALPTGSPSTIEPTVSEAPSPTPSTVTQVPLSNANVIVDVVGLNAEEFAFQTAEYLFENMQPFFDDLVEILVGVVDIVDLDRRRASEEFEPTSHLEEEKEEFVPTNNLEEKKEEEGRELDHRQYYHGREVLSIEISIIAVVSGDVTPSLVASLNTAMAAFLTSIGPYQTSLRSNQAVAKRISVLKVMIQAAPPAGPLVHPTRHPTPARPPSRGKGKGYTPPTKGKGTKTFYGTMQYRPGPFDPKKKVRGKGYPSPTKGKGYPSPTKGKGYPSPTKKHYRPWPQKHYPQTMQYPPMYHGPRHPPMYHRPKPQPMYYPMGTYQKIPKSTKQHSWGWSRPAPKTTRNWQNQYQGAQKRHPYSSNTFTQQRGGHRTQPQQRTRPGNRNGNGGGGLFGGNRRIDEKTEEENVGNE